MIKLKDLLENVNIDSKFNSDLINYINKEYREDYTTLTPREINDGYCDLWASLFVKKFGGEHQWSYDFPNEPNAHSWVKLNNKFYDAEAPNGVSSLIELPEFQRFISKYGNEWLNDSFYKNIQSSTTEITEDLRDWFGKGGKGGVGGGGWDRYNSSGDRIGKCGDAKEGDAYSACLSKEKAEKLGKEGRAAFVKRKRAAQKKGGDAKKGGEKTKGQKAIKVKTGVKEEITPEQSEKIGMPYKGKNNQKLKENFKDGKNPERKGLSKKFGISQTMTIDQLKNIAKSSTGKKQKMAQWNLNMKRGRMKKENLDPNTYTDKNSSVPYGSGYERINELERQLTLFLEKNIPTNPSKWSYYKSQAKKKFDVYPSAYANGWAAKMYKKAGGGWRKS